MGNVYFVRCRLSGCIKIGFTTNVKQRVSDLNRGTPGGVEVIHVAEGTRDGEQGLHTLLKDHRVKRVGEWYHPAEAVTAEINAIAQTSSAVTKERYPVKVSQRKGVPLSGPRAAKFSGRHPKYLGEFDDPSGDERQRRIRQSANEATDAWFDAIKDAGFGSIEFNHGLSIDKETGRPRCAAVFSSDRTLTTLIDTLRGRATTDGGRWLIAHSAWVADGTDHPEITGRVVRDVDIARFEPHDTAADVTRTVAEINRLIRYIIEAVVQDLARCAIDPMPASRIESLGGGRYGVLPPQAAPDHWLNKHQFRAARVFKQVDPDFFPFGIF